MKGSSSAVRHSRLSLKAPAKINWFLGVGGKRADGYHDITSLMQCISLCDTLTFDNADSISVTSDLAVPVRDNLVYKAASVLKEYTSFGKGADILLKKSVPVSAGLGGGSSDAAYTLLGLNELWGLGLSRNRLSAIASEIGSDVPFFLSGPAALVEGRGEKTIRVDRMSRNRGELTKKVVDIKLFCRALTRKDFSSLGNMLFNDLEEIVAEKYPVVMEIKLRLIEQGAFFAAMSGSGPTIFGVFGSAEAAEKAAGRMGNHLCRVVETLVA